MSLRLKPGGRTPDIPRPGMAVPDLGRAGAPGPNGQPRLLVFASLYCADCIELFPHLAQASAALPEYRFILIVAGDPGDVREMSDYFAWTFPVYPVNARDMLDVLGVRTYPLAIFDLGDGKVARAAAVHDEAEIRRLAEGLLMKGGEKYGLRMPDELHA
ncbi:TlpA family protein disulfide reductase [Cohnella sp. GCM10020058]|uniref:TlpA family protein disulfide reductase n=1 Tax=Cohnella sp. GCM10020058 TaxID=3317330 RepID=UPI0036415D87